MVIFFSTFPWVFAVSNGCSYSYNSFILPFYFSADCCCLQLSFWAKILFCQFWSSLHNNICLQHFSHSFYTGGFLEDWNTKSDFTFLQGPHFDKHLALYWHVPFSRRCWSHLCHYNCLHTKEHKVLRIFEIIRCKSFVIENLIYGLK